MSDYPRPFSLTPRRPYPPDRIVAFVFAGLYLLSKIIWLLSFFHRPDVATSIQSWWWYYLADLAFLFLYGWVFLNCARSRFWAFVTTLFMACLSILSSTLLHRPVYTVVCFVLIVYSVARLFGILGPRPLRRIDFFPSGEVRSG